ncbi:MAG: hypothetical protein J6Z46_10000, partial [Lachnospiraceae bacterium]|nr:hypothetical protein [Lachnospiraceae bacterium]
MSKEIQNRQNSELQAYGTPEEQVRLIRNLTKRVYELEQEVKEIKAAVMPAAESKPSVESKPAEAVKASAAEHVQPVVTETPDRKVAENVARVAMPATGQNP